MNEAQQTKSPRESLSKWRGAIIGCVVVLVAMLSVGLLFNAKPDSESEPASGQATQESVQAVEYRVGEHDGYAVVFASTQSDPVYISKVAVAALSESDAASVRSGISVDSFDEGREILQGYSDDVAAMKYLIGVYDGRVVIARADDLEYLCFESDASLIDKLEPWAVKFLTKYAAAAGTYDDAMRLINNPDKLNVFLRESAESWYENNRAYFSSGSKYYYGGYVYGDDLRIGIFAPGRDEPVYISTFSAAFEPSDTFADVFIAGATLERLSVAYQGMGAVRTLLVNRGYVEELEFSQLLPGVWQGAFGSWSSNNDEGTDDARMYMTLTADGDRLSGECYVIVDESEGIAGSYRIEGTYDSETGRVSLVGTEWIDKGTLGKMRSFEGVYDPAAQTITGTCETLDGSRSSNWIAILDAA